MFALSAIKVVVELILLLDIQPNVKELFTQNKINQKIIMKDGNIDMHSYRNIEKGAVEATYAIRYMTKFTDDKVTR